MLGGFYVSNFYYGGSTFSGSQGPFSATVTGTYTWSVISPVAGGYAGPRLDNSIRLRNLSAFCVGATNIMINIQERTSPSSNGYNIFSSNFEVLPNGTTTSQFARQTLLSGNWLWLDVVTVSGSATHLGITLSYEYDIVVE